MADKFNRYQIHANGRPVGHIDGRNPSEAIDNAHSKFGLDDCSEVTATEAPAHKHLTEDQRQRVLALVAECDPGELLLTVAGTVRRRIESPEIAEKFLAAMFAARAQAMKGTD